MQNHQVKIRSQNKHKYFVGIVIGERLIRKYLTLRANVTAQQKQDLLEAWNAVKHTREYYTSVYTIEEGQIKPLPEN